MKITVAGTGYLCLSLAVLLAQHNQVVALDVLSEKVDLINQRISPIYDDQISEYLSSKKLDLISTLDKELAYKNADFVIIATPTDYDSVNNHFNTSSIESVIKDVLEFNPSAVMIIKSTVPVGYTQSLKIKFGIDNIIELTH